MFAEPADSELSPFLTQQYDGWVTLTDPYLLDGLLVLRLACGRKAE